MAAHAKLSASGAERWLTCPGSIKAEESIPDKSSKFAMEGTAAHELAELCLTKNRTAISYLNQTLPESSWKVDEDMAEHVQTYVDYVDQFKGHRMIEQRVDFSKYVPDGFGTSDGIIIDNDTMHIIDLKFGKGIRVDADNNSQGKLYAIGALCDYGFVYDVERIVIHIVQPRIDHISVWEISAVELLAWAEWVKGRAQLCSEPDAPRVASEKACLWCKAKPTCPELMALTESATLADFTDISVSPKSPDKLSLRDLRFALDNKKLIISWLDAVENLAFERLSSGEEFAGYKLVHGRSSRSWVDTQEAEQVLFEELGDALFAPKKIITAPQAEKLLGKKKIGLLDGLVSKHEGKPTMVPESDNRPEISSGDISDFD
jgi:hypothetical protein